LNKAKEGMINVIGHNILLHPSKAILSLFSLFKTSQVIVKEDGKKLSLGEKLFKLFLKLFSVLYPVNIRCQSSI
jgi:hypothetical protein